MKADVVIIGAGPAGCACAIHLGNSGLNVVLIDKSHFPRDKVCGGAISVFAIRAMKKLPVNNDMFFIRTGEIMASGGAILSSPDGTLLEVEFGDTPELKTPGYLVSRLILDEYLLGQARQFSNVKVLEGEKVHGIRLETDSVRILTGGEEIRSKVVVGADGYPSVVERSVYPNRKDKPDLAIGAMAVFENVEMSQNRSKSEFFFLNHLLPGYFWIFPQADGTVNSGIYMKFTKGSGMHIKDIFLQTIQQDRQVAGRFAGARMLGNIKTGIIPLGTKKRDISGDRMMLIGDAASIADPFIGEGIYYALQSGETAAKWIRKCFDDQNFNKEFIKNYDKELYDTLWPILKVSKIVHKRFSSCGTVNLLFRKARKLPHLREKFRQIYLDLDYRRRIAGKLRYLSLFFR